MPRQKSMTHGEVGGQQVLLVHRMRGTIILDLEDKGVLDDVCISILASKAVSPTVVAYTKGWSKRVGRLSRILLNSPKELNVDHINGNPLDNRKTNLRIASSQQNNRNRAKTARPKSSQFKGVCKNGGRWYAIIYQNYRQIFIGSFSTEIDAAQAYDAKAREFSAILQP